MTENVTDAGAETVDAEQGAAVEPQAVPGDLQAEAAPRRRPARRAPKLDPVLAAAVDRARDGVLEIAPSEQIGAHVGTFADGDRLVTHRFEAQLAGYTGWQWFATLARVPRGKEATVCEVGLLPSEKSLLAPEWVPWADRVRPEEAAAAAEAEAAERSEAAAANDEAEAVDQSEAAAANDVAAADRTEEAAADDVAEAADGIEEAAADVADDSGAAEDGVAAAEDQPPATEDIAEGNGNETPDVTATETSDITATEDGAETTS